MKTANNISAVTLGTVQLGLDYGIANRHGKPDEEIAFQILDSALDNGINCMDTAAAYGDSEKIIGKYFSRVRKKGPGVTIVTKLSLGQTEISLTEKTMMRSAEQSLKNLNTSSLDILLLHDAKEFKTHGKMIVETFGKLLKEGTIKAAGASCYGLNEIGSMLENDVFSVFQIPVNLLDNPLHDQETIKRLSGKFIFARSIFLQGLFLMDVSALEGRLKDAAPFLSKIQSAAKEMDMSVKELAVRYVRSLGFADSLVIGAETPHQVEENAKLMRSDLLTPGEVSSVRKLLAGAPEWITKPYLWYAGEK